jgi:hypothetical protein
MNFAAQASELNGYLKLLQRLCKRPCHFSATSASTGGNIEKFSEEYTAQFKDILTFKELRKISYDDIKEMLTTYIYSNLVQLDTDLLKLIDWDIAEFFGLASTTFGTKGEFSPLLKGGWKIEINSDIYESSVMLIIEYGKKAIVLNLGIIKADR